MGFWGDMTPCNGNKCPRREECQRFLLLKFEKSPFLDVMCGWEGGHYIDNFEQVEIPVLTEVVEC